LAIQIIDHVRQHGRVTMADMVRTIRLLGKFRPLGRCGVFGD
jgi:hypothetical protein